MHSVKRKAQNAITFIELIFVIVILGILTAVSLPRFRKTLNDLQLNSISRELQTVMNYLNQRSIVEGKIIYLNIDRDRQEYWACVKDTQNRLRTCQIPAGVSIETEKKQIIFYPDGTISKASIRIFNSDNQGISLTTKGVFGGVKLQSQE